MALKVIKWDADAAKKELKKRLDAAKQGRQCYESRWFEAEDLLYSTQQSGDGASIGLSEDGMLGFFSGDDGVPREHPDLVVNMIMKDIRFIHSQMSSNPPTIVPRPTSADIEDRRAADAANRLIKHGMRAYMIPEKQDRVNLHTLIYGTGFGKTVWNPHKGEILDYDGDEITMEGDFDLTTPITWNIYPEAGPAYWDDVRYVFEALPMPLEEALSIFPEKEDVLKNATLHKSKSLFSRQESECEVVTIFEYYEKGMPVNGMQGRHCFLLEDGTLLTDVEESPHRFYQRTSRKNKSAIQIAQLPYHIFTDIDLPNTYWGASTINFSARSQEFLNELMNTSLDIIRALGTPKMILPEGTEISADLSNSPWEIMKVSGNQGAWHMEGAKVPPSTTEFIDRMSKAIMDMNGTSPELFGNMERETSGFALQYATQQANMLRRRLFNKYVLYVEDIYKNYLSIVQDNWEVARTIHVLGKEKAFEAKEISGADIAGGFDIVGEYGASFSLDPMQRKEELLMHMPLFEKAGVPSRKILSMLRLSELEGLYDLLDLAEDRQREIIEEMTLTGQYIAPELLEDHINMLAYLEMYRMSADYKYLSKKNKDLVERHYLERAKMAGQKQQVIQQGGAMQPAPPTGLAAPAAPGGQGMAPPMPPIA